VKNETKKEKAEAKGSSFQKVKILVSRTKIRKRGKKLIAK